MPNLNAIGIVASDMGTSIRFYRALGLQSAGVTATEFAGDDTHPAGAIVMFHLDGGSKAHYVIHGIWPHDDAIAIAPEPGRPRPPRLQAPRPDRGRRHPAGRVADRRQPPRRHPTPTTDRQGPTGTRPARPATPATRTAVRRPRLRHGMRRLRIRWERRDDIHEAFLSLATGIITYRHVTQLC